MTEARAAAPRATGQPDESVRRMQALLAANQYLTLATADRDGRPWAATVWYAAHVTSGAGSRTSVELLWLSRPEAQHSRNLQHRPEVGITIFDSRQPPDTGEGLQFAARAEPVPEADLDEGIATFCTASIAAGGRSWGRSDIEAPAFLRLYRARVEVAYVLGTGEREQVPLE